MKPRKYPGGVTVRPANVDAAGFTVRSGHTVHLGAAVGRVESVDRGYAVVHWISGCDTSVACSRLTVQRSLGRIVKRKASPFHAADYVAAEQHLRKRLAEFVS